MAEPIFKTIDYSNQIANNNKAASDSMVKGIQNISNTFLAGRQQNINQARQLMSDFDAVINEVDDMHKENVSEEIAKTQQELAKNIYGKKGKNGVRLQLGDMNSENFNYARDMRKLKNLAANSRNLKLNFTEAKDFVKNNRYMTQQDRTNYLADISTYFSDPKTLSQTPEEVNEQKKTIALKHHDVASEISDMIIKDQVTNKSTSFSIVDGNEMQTTTSTRGELAIQDADGNFITNDSLIEEYVQKFISQRGYDQSYSDGLIDKVKADAITNIKNKSIATATTRSQSELDMKGKKSRIAYTESLTNKSKTDLENDEFARDKLTNMVSLISLGTGKQQLDLLKATSKINDARYFNTKDDFIEYMINRDRTNAPAGPDGMKLWQEGKAPLFKDIKNNRTLKDYNDKPSTEAKKAAKVFDYYGKIYDDAGAKSLVFFDYEDDRNYSLIDRRNQEVIQQAILSQPTNQVRGLRENPFGQLDTPLTEDRESNPGSGTFGKYSKNN